MQQKFQVGDFHGFLPLGWMVL